MPLQHASKSRGGAFSGSVPTAAASSWARANVAEPAVKPAIRTTPAADIARYFRNPFIAKSSSKNYAVKFPLLALAVTDRLTARAQRLQIRASLPISLLAFLF